MDAPSQRFLAQNEFEEQSLLRWQLSDIPNRPRAMEDPRPADIGEHTPLLLGDGRLSDGGAAAGNVAKPEADADALLSKWEIAVHESRHFVQLAVPIVRVAPFRWRCSSTDALCLTFRRSQPCLISCRTSYSA